MAYSGNEELVDYSGDISDQEMPAADHNIAPTTSIDSLPILSAGVREGTIRERDAASKLPPRYQPWDSVVSNEDADETLEMTKVAHLPTSLPEMAVEAFNYATPLLLALDPADSFGCKQWVKLTCYLVFSSSSAGAKDPVQAFLHVVQINQAGGVDCWSHCIAEAQAVPRLGVRLTADASATVGPSARAGFRQPRGRHGKPCLTCCTIECKCSERATN